MSHVKTLSTALFAVLVLAAAFTATSAFAGLPDMHVAVGGTYPVTGEGSVGNGTTVVVTFQTTLGETITCEKLTVVTTLKELSSLQPVELKYTGCKEKAGNECHTPSLAEGVITVFGEQHLVYTGLGTLFAGYLDLFSELTIACNKEKLKVKVKAPSLTKLTVSAGSEVTEAKIETACTKGKQEPKEYYNDEEKLTVANLLMNFGLGFESGCVRDDPLTIKYSQKVDLLF